MFGRSLVILMVVTLTVVSTLVAGHTREDYTRIYQCDKCCVENDYAEGGTFDDQDCLCVWWDDFWGVQGTTILDACSHIHPYTFG